MLHQRVVSVLVCQCHLILMCEVEIIDAQYQRLQAFLSSQRLRKGLDKRRLARSLDAIETYEEWLLGMSGLVGMQMFEYEGYAVC